MAHARAMIRQAVVDLLATPSGIVYPTDAGANVFKSRVRALWPAELPCIAVYVRSDDAAVFNQSPIEYKRSAEVVVEIAAKLDEDLDETLDTIAAQVERVLFLNETLKPDDWPHECWPELRLANTSITLVGDQGETQHGAAIITFDCTYYQEAPADITDTADGLAADIQDLDTVGVSWNLENDQAPDDRAVDLYSMARVFDNSFDSTFG